MSPSTSNEFRRNLDRAITEAEARKANKDTCSGCKRSLALMMLSFRGLKVGYLCRFCPRTSFDVSKEPKSKLKSEAARRKR